jgi:hypothetical protein
MVFDAFTQHELGQHRAGDGKDHFLRAAAALDLKELCPQVAVPSCGWRPLRHLKRGLNHGALWRVRVEHVFTALSSRRGQKPAQEIR